MTDEVVQELEDFFNDRFPGKTVEFAEGWDDDINLEVEKESFVRALRKVNRRLSGPFRFFWRWYYRPRPWDGED